MIKQSHRSIRLLMFFVLIAGLIPRWAVADDGSKQRPIRLYATAAFGPIGEVYAAGPIAINNQWVQGQQAVWDGDLIETLTETRAGVVLDVVGQVTLTNGAAVRFAIKPVDVDEGKVGHMLVASLDRGDMAVKLKQEASAYVEAGDSAYTATFGASFSLGIRGGRAIIHETSGAFRTESQQRTLTIKPRAVQATPSSVTQVLNSPLETKVKKKKRVDVQWMKYYGASISRLVAYTPGDWPAHSATAQAAQPGEAAANRFVFFRVEPQGIGEIVDANDQVITGAFTDSRGVVSVYFRAGANEATGQIIADIKPDQSDPPDTRTEEFRQSVTVTKGSFWTTRKIVAAAGAASAVIISCCVIHGNTEPVQQNPPPVISP